MRAVASEAVALRSKRDILKSGIVREKWEIKWKDRTSVFIKTNLLSYLSLSAY